MIQYLKVKNHESKKKYKKDKTLTAIVKTFDTFVNIATTTSSITLTLTGNGLIAKPISTATACGLSIGNKITYEIIMQKYNNYQNRYKKDKKVVKSFDNLYKKYLKDNVIDKTDFEYLCNIFTKNLDGTKN